MPAIKMKTKSVPSCGNEGTFLSVCRESSKICKRKRPVAPESHETHLEMSEACESGQCELEEVAKEIAIDEPFIETFNGGNDFTFQERLFPDRDSNSAMDSLFPMNLEISSSQSLCPNCNSDASNSPGPEDVPSEAKMPSDNRDGQNHDSYSPRFSNESDQLISDMSTAALPSAEATGLDDIIRISFFQEIECAEPNLILDVTESCILFSSMDEQVNTPVFQDRGSSGELLMTNSDNSWFHLVTHQAKPSNQALLTSGPLDADETDSFDAHLFIRNFLDLSDLETSSLPALLPKESYKQKSVTLVLDLDETLIHSTTEPCEDADFTFKVFFNMEEHMVYVRKRPFLKTFLERVSEMFEIVIFTASESVYAGQLLDMLDPDKKFFSRRVYRDSCIVVNGNYTKDLTVLGVDLAKCAIVDNCPQVFQLQVSNGIPIPSWFDDPLDRALMSLIPFLETLAEAEDVRPIILKKFGSNRE